MKKFPEERKASAVIPVLWIAQKQDGSVCRVRHVRDRGAALRDGLLLLSCSSLAQAPADTFAL
ncbi:MAG: hypothetical protein ACFCU3_07355 [Verrucomicrobiales bacterium]